MAFSASLMQGEAADYHMLLRMIGQIKVSSDRFRCVFVVFQSTSGRCSRNRSPSRLPVSSMYNFLQRVQVIQYMTLVEVQVK